MSRKDSAGKGREVSDLKFALVAANWHGDLVSQATQACSAELAKLGVNTETNTTLVHVPGSLELPLACKKLASSGVLDGVIAFGLITDGGIYRHEFVANAVIDGLVNTGLETMVPILSCVLTPQGVFDEADAEQVEFFKNHLVGKGKEAAHAAVETAMTFSSLG